MNKGFERELKNLKSSYEEIIADKDRTINELNYQKEHDIDYLSKRMDKKVKGLEVNYKDRLDEMRQKHKVEMERMQEQVRS